MTTTHYVSSALTVLLLGSTGVASMPRASHVPHLHATFFAASTRLTRATVARPTIEVTPGSAPDGATVTVSGAGFGAREAVTLVFDGNAAFAAHTRATSAGLLETTPFTVPSAAGVGIHYIVASGAIRGHTASARLEVRAMRTTLAVTPSSATSGSTVTVSGAGFGAGEAVTLVFDGNAAFAAHTHAMADGTLAATPFTVPTGAGVGIHYIVASGAIRGHTASARLEVRAMRTTLAVTPSSALGGAVVTVSGSGFGAREAVTLVFDGNPAFAARTHATSAGILATMPFTIPTVAGVGTHHIVASGAIRGHTASARLEVRAVHTTLSVTPGSVTRGATVAVSGAGFGANETVTLVFDGNSAFAAHTRATASGILMATPFTVPTVAEVGTHYIVASGAIRGHTASARVHVVTSTH